MPTERLEIRPIELPDVPAMLRIMADARQEYGIAERGVPLLEPADHALYAGYQRQRSLYFVAIAADEVIGGAGVAPLAGADPLTCELQRMYLRADVRGRGYGAQLLQQCLTAARQFLYVRCYLETLSPMREALHFYRRHGFQALPVPMGRTGHSHNDQWLMRALKPLSREWLGSLEHPAVEDRLAWA